MVCIKLLPPTKQLTNMFSSSSSSSSSPLPSTSSPAASTQVQSTTTAAVGAGESSICKRIRSRNGGPSARVLFMVLLDLWGIVPIIVLITTTGTPTTVSAVSIAAVSIASNAYGDSKGNGISGNFDNHHQQQHQPGQSPQPHKLSFLTGNDAKGNGSSVGVLNLPFGELIFANKLQQQEQRKKEMGGKSIKNKGVIAKRNVGDTRITSNQDVTTLALAVDNSSAVAIANINSSFNHVSVIIGPNAFPTRFDLHASEMSDSDK